ncbi:hypothetical protein [Ruegeria sp. HKCCA0235A]|uniref:hypothetical protein n=1 Tax=Ruegeria sp. HKCCA0235A TaxID=2682998 RepID=UPI00148761A6|nr:hypothetical protein [Ruegeria sp. HKCCA0235A]
MPFIRAVLGYLVAVFVGTVLLLLLMESQTENGMGWRAVMFRVPSYWLFGLIFTVLPAFALRLTAVIFHLFHPITAAVFGALTGVAVYLLVSTENMTGRPLVVDLHDLLLFSVAGAIAGLVWLWVERLGTNKE